MNIKDMEEFIKQHEKGSFKTATKETEASNKELDFGLKIVIDNMVYQKVMYWVHKSSDEVSGLGNVIYEPETNTIRVIDAIMLPQTNTGGSTDIDADAVAKAMFLMHKNKVPGQLKWWWHSHVNMGVFWSGTDVATIKQLGGGGWFSATVFNKRAEMLSAFCQKDPVRLMAPKIETFIAHPANTELIAKWDEEYTKNVKEKPKFLGSFQGSWRGWRKDAEQEAKKEAQEETTKASSKDDDYDWEEVTDPMTGATRYERVKKNNAPNKVPVRSLAEGRVPSRAEVEAAIADSDLRDLASEEELARWERSSGDELEGSNAETKEDEPQDVFSFMMDDKNYGD